MLPVAPSSPWVLSSGIDLQISAQPRSQEALSAISLSLYAAPPLCCSALQLPATLSSLSRDLCRCNSERPLCAVFPLLNKPWKLLWAGNSPHLLPFSFPSQPQSWCRATYGPVSKTCFIFVGFFFFFKLFKAGSKPGPLWV